LEDEHTAPLGRDESAPAPVERSRRFGVSERARAPEALDQRLGQYLEPANEEDASAPASEGGESMLERIERRGGTVGHRRVESAHAEANRQVPAGDVDEQVWEAQRIRALAR